VKIVYISDIDVLVASCVFVAMFSIKDKIFAFSTDIGAQAFTGAVGTKAFAIGDKILRGGKCTGSGAFCPTVDMGENMSGIGRGNSCIGWRSAST